MTKVGIGEGRTPASSKGLGSLLPNTQGLRTATIAKVSIVFYIDIVKLVFSVTADALRSILF